MFLAEVIGQVVSTKKDELMVGRKLLLLRPKLVDDKDPSKFKDGQNTIVAIDTVGAGEGELVLFCQGSSARAAHQIGSFRTSLLLTHALRRLSVQCDHIHLSGISASSVIASGVIDLSGAFQEEPQGLE